MEETMMCKGCGKSEAQCSCENCPCKGGKCEMGGDCCKPGICPCKHHKIVPCLVVLFGLTFLLGALNVLSAGAVAVIWPIIIILAGLAKMKGGMCGCYKKHY